MQNMKKKKPAKSAKQGGHINKAFQILPTQLLVDVASRKISASAYALYGFLHFWQGQKSELWWGVDSIAEATGFSEAKVKRLIKELVEARHIARSKRMGANWRTKCLTRVDKTRAVFVAGEQVNRQANQPTGPLSAAPSNPTDCDSYEHETKNDLNEKLGWSDDEKNLFESLY